MTRSALSSVSFVLLGLLAACGSTADSRFYVLTPGSNAPPGTSQLVVTVHPVTIPSVLDRPQIVTRLGDHERALAEFARWAEPLADNVTYVVAENLATLLATDRVTVQPRGREEGVTVSIRILRFDVTLDQGCTLLAQWRILTPEGETLAVERTQHESALASDEFEAVAAAMSAALDRLCRDIAEAVRKNAGG